MAHPWGPVVVVLLMVTMRTISQAVSLNTVSPSQSSSPPPPQKKLGKQGCCLTLQLGFLQGSNVLLLSRNPAE